jgi:hypothetical protein
LGKYLYCEANPINRHDPSGHKVSCDPSLEADFNTATIYLEQSASAADFLDWITSDADTVVYYVVPATEAYISPDWTTYEGGVPHIHWASRLAMAIHSNKACSPALNLIHELRHGYHHVEQFEEGDDNNVNTMSFENEVARDLNELGYDEGVRTGHHDGLYDFEVSSPTKVGPIPKETPAERISRKLGGKFAPVPAFPSTNHLLELDIVEQ